MKSLTVKTPAPKSSTPKSPAPKSANVRNPVKELRLSDRDQQGDARLVRTVAFTFLAAVAVLALFFGRDVLVPMAVAILFAFILSPLVTGLRRAMPLPLSVTIVVVGAVVACSVVAVLVFSQLAEVAGSLTQYQSNLHQKIEDVRGLSKGGGAVSRFMAMAASLAQDFAADAGSAATPAVAVQSSATSFANVAAFVAPLLHPLLSLGIIVILAVFILLDRDHLSDQFVRLFGSSDVHAASEALSDAAVRVARMLSLQLLTNVGFAVLVGVSLFALGMPNAVLWGLLAGTLRFIPYIGATLGAVLPTVIAFAVLPGWLHPLLVLGVIIGLDIVIGQFVEPLLFGDSTGVTPLALILSAIFWGTLWGPVGLLLSTPLTICLLVVGRHVPYLGFLEVLLGAEPALSPYQQIYRRLIRKAVHDAAEVALEEIDAKGFDKGLDDAMGRMVVLADADRLRDRLTPELVAAIVEGTDEVLDFLAEAGSETPPPRPAASAAVFLCIGGRGAVDDACAAIVAFALRHRGFEAPRLRHGKLPDDIEARPATALICYASHPSDAVRRYNACKLPAEIALQARHIVLDYDVAPTPAIALAAAAGPRDLIAGDIESVCRLVTQQTVAVV